MTFCLFLFYILFPNNLVTNIVFPGKQGICLENGIRPPFLFYKLDKSVLSAGFFILEGRGGGGGGAVFVITILQFHDIYPKKEVEPHYFSAVTSRPHICFNLLPNLFVGSNLLIKKITISSIVVGFKKTPLVIHLPSCYRRVCY